MKDLSVQLEQAQSAFERKEVEVAFSKRQLAKTEEKLAELSARYDQLEQQSRQDRDQLARKQQQLKELALQHDSLRSLVALRAGRIRELETLLAKREQELETLKQQLDSAPEAEPADDLRAIPGIGPVLEQRLFELGIRSYQQIAAWTEDDVVEMAAALRIHSGRIWHHDWIGLAAKLARGSGRGGAS